MPKKKNRKVSENQKVGRIEKLNFGAEQSGRSRDWGNLLSAIEI